MIDAFILLLAGGAYWAEYFGLAFWVVVFAILNGAAAVTKAVADPTWYMMKRMEAGLDPGNGVGGLVASKAILIVILCVVAWYLGIKAGYF